MKVNELMKDERGIALVVVLLVVFAVGAISSGAALMNLNVQLVNNYSNRINLLESVADAGLEEARSRINGTSSLYPDSSFVTLENGASVTDASGATIPGVRRTTYVGPTGITTGQYGVFGSIVSVAEDEHGNRVVRRGEIVQESFAKYAYFTNVEGNIWFGGGDQIWGPVHSNDRIQIHSTGATFHSTVETNRYVSYAYNGDFRQGYSEGAPYIPMPDVAELNKLRGQASTGGTAYVGDFAGGTGRASTRIEFVGVDLNGDGQINGDNEGFIKVYQSGNERWVIGDAPSDYGTNGLRNSENCGAFSGGYFQRADDMSNSQWDNLLQQNDRRCYPGGSDILNADALNPNGRFLANDGMGQWIAWGGAVAPAVAAARPADAAYLHPINRAFNPSFKGVIFVDGNVAISGNLRGRVTIAATGDIVIADDMTYVTDPGAGTCNDLMGIFAGGYVRVADNPINSPWRIYRPGVSNNPYRTFDDSTGEFIHGVVLTLNQFTVVNYNAGSSSAQPCQTSQAGRGCLYLTGGIIQRQRGAVGLTSGRGYIKRYSYDQCAAEQPPPYFPTTGHFAKARYFEVDPTGFDAQSYYDMLAPQ